MKIKDIVFTQGVSAYFFDDQLAIKQGAVRDGTLYRGEAVTPGFHSIRMPGESVSIGILPEEGTIAFGDCCAVQYSGAGGRDPVFRADKYVPFLEEKIKPLLKGQEFSSFREVCQYIESLRVKGGGKLHTAIRYGLTQALLSVFATVRHKTMAEMIAEEYSLPIHSERVKILGQCGDARYENVDKMIIKQVDLLPHGLVNNVEEKFGPHGEKLKDYVSWVSDRILDVRNDPDYIPDIYLDVYGLPGMVFDNDISKILALLGELADRAQPFSLKVEGPVDAGGRAGQISVMKKLMEGVEREGIPVELVADEWCNTLEDIDVFSREGAAHMLQIKTPDLGGINASIEAVLLCQSRGVKAYLGGTCNETDISARVCTHVAMATHPDQILAKPGMGFDEGYMVVRNEMERIMALMERL